MGAGDYTPSASGRAKSITKAQLRKMQEDYARAEEIAKEALEQEKKEKERASREMNDLLGDVF
ncbi:MAG: hypothetical protein PHN60_01895 [Candidatus Gracilibacteria bacterium]|nr:hypothetical protein [Candidatus Gracilibacteria bacterium]